MTDSAHAPEPYLSDRDRALLVGLADGTLSGARRARAEARVREIPGAARLIERQRRVARALTLGPATPRAPAVVPKAAPRAWRLMPRLAGAGALAAVAVLCIAVALQLVGGPSTVAQAADLARMPATQAAPDSSGQQLQAPVDGVPFPDWGGRFGWHETGARRDTLDGRATRTVFYEHMGHRIAYTIVSGSPLPMPEHARIVRRGGRAIAVYHDPRHGGHDIAVFRRGGRTCVLAGHVLRQSTLIALAAWDPERALTD
jgi:hypothetical protein